MSIASVRRLLFVSVCLVGVVGGLFKLFVTFDFAPLLPVEPTILVEELLLFVDLSFFDEAPSPVSPFSVLLVAAVFADALATEFVGESDSSSDRAPREIKNKSGTK